MVAVPDLAAALEQDAIDLDTFKAVQLGMIAHCELMGDRVAILDTPPDLDPQQVHKWRTKRRRLRLEVRDHVLAVGQGVRPGVGRQQVRAAVRPHGGRVGAQRRHPRRAQGAGQRGGARRDHACRPRSPRPSTTCSTRWASTAFGSFPGRGVRVWGARTLSSDAEWRYLNVRRLFNYLEESILLGTQWVVFEPNDHALWARIRRTISAFLINEWRKGALFGTTPGRGVLRQVRRRDQPGRGHRRRPGRVPDRRGAGEAGRVRHLPAVAVLRRHQPRIRIDPNRTEETRHGTRRPLDSALGQRLHRHRRRDPDPKVNEVSGLKSEVDKIELKQQTSDGKYVVRQLIGRPKAGEVTVTRA